MGSRSFGPFTLTGGMLAGVRRVPVVRLDDVAGVCREPLLMKLDVEGAELDALDGGRETLGRAEVVLLEASLFEYVPAQPLLHDVIGYMAEAGWVVYDFYDPHVRLLDGALGQLDLVFIKRDGRFRRDQRFATPQQADALYQSWGY
jgi:Methyltransferase FkbM domain